MAHRLLSPLLFGDQWNFYAFENRMAGYSNKAFIHGFRPEPCNNRPWVGRLPFFQIGLAQKDGIRDRIGKSMNIRRLNNL